MLLCRTARISYGGEDRLDITWKTSNGIGRAFAPSWQILEPALRARRQAMALREAGNATAADQLMALTWTRYELAYRQEMRESYRIRRSDWDALLARPIVTLVCYCTDQAMCHRTLLAAYLGKLGATVGGELVAGKTEERKGHDRHRSERRKGRTRTEPGGG